MALDEGLHTSKDGRVYQVLRNLIGDIVVNDSYGKLVFFIVEHDLPRFATVTSDDLIELADCAFKRGLDAGVDIYKKKLRKAMAVL